MVSWLLWPWSLSWVWFGRHDDLGVCWESGGCERQWVLRVHGLRGLLSLRTRGLLLAMSLTFERIVYFVHLLYFFFLFFFFSLHLVSNLCFSFFCCFQFLGCRPYSYGWLLCYLRLVLGCRLVCHTPPRRLTSSSCETRCDLSILTC